MSLIELNLKDVRLGEVLPWAVFDKKNRLLYNKGSVINSEKQLSVLLKKGLYRKEGEGAEEQDNIADVNPFHLIGELTVRLRRVYESLFTVDPPKDVETRVERICARLIQLCDTDVDAALGAVHLDQKEQYTIIHPLHTAILCYLIAERLEFDRSRTYSLMAAALTSNVGMIDLQETLQTQSGPLTDQQRKRIHAHPEEGVDLLQRAGVEDDVWIKVVLQHHERLDGSGYPLGLKDDAFTREARILAVADRYHAMVSTRGYRSSMPPTEALKKLFVTRGQEVDHTLAQLFIKELGVYPPGTYVELGNGETAIVTRRGNDKMKPVVKSVFSNKGMPFMRALTRYTDKPGFSVVRLSKPKMAGHINLLALWDYEK